MNTTTIFTKFSLYCFAAVCKLSLIQLMKMGPVWQKKRVNHIK